MNYNNADPADIRADGQTFRSCHEVKKLISD